MTQGQLGRLVKKGKLTQEQADAQVDEVVGRITGTTDYEGFGDVDFVIEAVPESMEIKQAVFGELDAVTPARDPRLQHLLAVDLRDRRGDAAAPQGRRLPLLLPRRGHAADRGHPGRRDLGRDRPGRGQLRAAIRKQPITCGEVPQGSSSTGSSTAARARSGAPRRSRASRSRRSTRPSAAPTRRPWARSSSTCSASTPCSTSPSTCGSPTATASTSTGDADSSARASSAPSPAARASTRAASRTSRATRRPIGEELAELFTLKALVEACLVLEEGVSTVREIDLGPDGRRRVDPRRGLFPPFWKADLEGLDVMLEKIERYGGAARRAVPPPTALRRLVAQGRLGLKSRPGLLRLPAAREGEQARGQARDARRRRDRLARQPADERDLPAGDRGPREVWEEVRATTVRRWSSPPRSARVLGRCRHQGVHDDGRGRRAPS